MVIYFILIELNKLDIKQNKHNNESSNQNSIKSKL